METWMMILMIRALHDIMIIVIGEIHVIMLIYPIIIRIIKVIVHMMGALRMTQSLIIHVKLGIIIWREIIMIMV